MVRKEVLFKKKDRKGERKWNYTELGEGGGGGGGGGLKSNCL